MKKWWNNEEPEVTADVTAKLTFKEKVNGKEYEIKLDAKGTMTAPILEYQKESRSDPEDWETDYENASYEITQLDWDYDGELESEFEDYTALCNFLEALQEEYITDIENEFSQNVGVETLK